LSFTGLRRGLMLLATLVSFVLLSAASPDAARADRCNPEELVGQEPILWPEDEGPVCDVMLGTVYPSLTCDSSTMRNCLTTLNAKHTAYKNLVPYEQCIPTSFISYYCPISDNLGG
jgi:hypothetical protein